MVKDKFSKIFPDHPRGIGLSKRFLLAMISGLLILMAFFLYFLHHYQPKAMTAGKEQVMINHTEAVSLIEEIKSHHGKRNRLSQLSHKSSLASIGDEQSVHIDKAFLKAAAQSSISVYHQAETHKNHFEMRSQNKLSHSDDGLRLPQSTHVNAYREQNQQSEKNNFLSTAAKNKDSMIRSRAQVAKSPYTLHAGTILPATLQTGINSGLPGTIIAKVRRDVCDSGTGND